MSLSYSPPEPQLRVKPFCEINGRDEMLLPRPILMVEGDGTNAWIVAGVRVSTRHSEPVFEIGVDLTIPPRLFWLLNDPVWKALNRLERRLRR